MWSRGTVAMLSLQYAPDRRWCPSCLLGIAPCLASILQVEAKPSIGLKTLHKRVPHQGARRPDPTLALNIAGQAESRLGNHPGGRAITRIPVTLDHQAE